MKIFYEVVGWYGAIAIMLAFFLSSFSIIDSVDLSYQLLNLTGAIGVIIVSAHKHTYQAAALNVVWSLIAMISIINIFV